MKLDLTPVKTESEAVELTLKFLGFDRLPNVWLKHISSTKQITIWVGMTQNFKLASQHFGGQFFKKDLDWIERYTCLNVSRILLELHKQWVSR